MLQRRAGMTRAMSVAYEFRLAGDVTLTSRAAVAAWVAANAPDTPTSAAITTTEESNRFIDPSSRTYIGRRIFTLESVSYKITAVFTPGDVISYLDMCREEGVNLQRGMNYRIRADSSVLLMSVRPGAPYADRVEEDGRVLIYEGHDQPTARG